MPPTDTIIEDDIFINGRELTVRYKKTLPTQTSADEPKDPGEIEIVSIAETTLDGLVLINWMDIDEDEQDDIECELGDL